MEGCQSKSKEITLIEKVCPKCGEIVEIASIDESAVCDNCGFTIFNDTLNCAMWCEYAVECFGQEKYDQIMKIANRSNQNKDDDSW